MDRKGPKGTERAVFSLATRVAAMSLYASQSAAELLFSTFFLNVFAKPYAIHFLRAHSIPPKNGRMANKARAASRISSLRDQENFGEVQQLLGASQTNIRCSQQRWGATSRESEEYSKVEYIGTAPPKR